jgi:ferredoxin--NADP+ reductase
VGVLVPGPHPFGNKFHFRLYTIADIPKKLKDNKTELNICVRRCNYIDEFSGEEQIGIASNYLCDRRTGEQITLTGPYGLPFEVPEDKTSDLLLIGMGTGIAPFRAFIKHIYNNIGGWKGKVRLFYGARTGLELLYMNDERDDFSNFYDEATFEAFKALSPRPHWDDPIALDYALEERAEEILKMLADPKTHVFVVGQEKIRDMLDRVFSRMLGSDEKWQRRKSELVAGKRWVEVLY